jgi:AcrR family transcriptional regulator
MGIKERRERERDEQCELIIQAASDIISEEGLENLSIRKIAKRIEYSPAIIYHYFKDKNEIVDQLMKQGYQKIVKAISSAMMIEGAPEDRLKMMTRVYIDTALQIPDEFLSIQLSKSEEILPYTASLNAGASKNKPALKILYSCLKDIFKEYELDEKTLELTAQIIAVSTFGLIIKLIIEKDIDPQQRDDLIEHFIKCMVDVMVMGKSLVG